MNHIFKPNLCNLYTYAHADIESHYVSIDRIAFSSGTDIFSAPHFFVYIPPISTLVCLKFAGREGKRKTINYWHSINRKDNIFKCYA